MRVQYRYQTSHYESKLHALYGPYHPLTIGWSEWEDAPPDGRGCSPMIVGSLQMRIVDDAGNVIPQTPPFKPAFYQRTNQPNGRPGGMTWCTEPPDNRFWMRRDDVPPHRV